MAAYLLERIAEDERGARAAYARDDYTGVLPNAARRDPAREIAECEAKRRVVEHCREVLMHHDAEWPVTDLAEDVLQRLVQVYAERPDFLLEWFLEWLPEVPG
jgi:hypothetical protein